MGTRADALCLRGPKGLEGWNKVGEYLHVAGQGLDAALWILTHALSHEEGEAVEELKDVLVRFSDLTNKLELLACEDGYYAPPESNPISGAIWREIPYPIKKPFMAWRVTNMPDYSRGTKPEDPLSGKELTWGAMCELEPRLEKLEEGVVHAKKRLGEDRFHFHYAWYGEPGYKGLMCDLVGWSALNPRLRTCAAYDLAYDRLYYGHVGAREDGAA